MEDKNPTLINHVHLGISLELCFQVDPEKVGLADYDELRASFSF